MPLLLSKRVSAYAAYSVWNIQETNDQLLQLAEDQVPNDLHPTRLAEWIVGRILLKSLAMQFGLRYRGVETRDTGKPFLTGSTAEVSISHSFPMAAAMINLHHPCGIDLERKRQKLITTQHKFINDKEAGSLNNLDELCAIWCGKEVLYKIHGRRQLSLKDETTIQILDANTLRGTIHKSDMNNSFMIRYEQLKDYYMAYSL